MTHEESQIRTYELYVTTAQTIRAERLSLGKFLSVAMSGIAIGPKFVSNPLSADYMLLLSSFGAVLAVIWVFIIRSYARQMKTRMEILNEFEQHMCMTFPFSSREYRRRGRLRPTRVEKAIPFTFLVFFLVMTVQSIYSMIVSYRASLGSAFLW